MEVGPSSHSHPRLWPRDQHLPTDEECLMFFEYLDRKTGKLAHVYSDESQAAKSQIFRDYLTGKLETATENYNRGTDRTLSIQSVRNRLNKWHLPTKPGEKVDFVKSISIGLQNFRTNELFELPGGMGKQRASFAIAVQPPEVETPSTNTEFDTPETWPLEPYGPPAGYLDPPAEYISATFAGEALPMPPSIHPPRMHGINSSLGVKLDDQTANADCRVSKLSVQTDQTNDSGYDSKHGSLLSIASFDNIPVTPYLRQLAFQPAQDVTMIESGTEGEILNQLPLHSVLHEPSPGDLRVEEETARSTAKVLIHDPRSGQWYGRLQALPCDEFHTHLRWDKMTLVCRTCGFSKAHSLPTHGHKIDAETYYKEFRKMRDEIFNGHGSNPPILRDLAGNTPVHFAAAAGLTYEHLDRMLSIFGKEIYSANVWGQNFFHVLDPICVGDKLSVLLRWFQNNRPGFIHEKDVFGKTALQSLLRHPLGPKVMKEVLLIFSEGQGGIFHQLQTLDSFGNDTSWLAVNLGKYEVILETVNAIIQKERVQGKHIQTQFSRNIVHDVVSTSQPSPKCPGCGGMDHNSADRFHQIECTIRAGAGENDYNENGLTPLQVLVSALRHEASGLPESCAITLLLVKKLLSCSASPHALLHARSREGKTALYMAAERGQPLVVEHLLNADPERKRAMANVRAHSGVSVLFATNNAFREAGQNNDEDMMKQYRAIHILLISAGGVLMSSDAFEWAL